MWMGERAVFWRVSVGVFLGVSGQAGEEACLGAENQGPAPLSRIP